MEKTQKGFRYSAEESAHSEAFREVYRRVNSEARNGREWHEKNLFYKNPAPANRIDSLFCPRYALERNSESLHRFSALRNGSKRNSESFLFRGTAGIPLEQTNCSVYSVFRGIICCRKLPTLSYPYHISTITFKVEVYAPAESADSLPLFLLYPYMYSVKPTKEGPLAFVPGGRKKRDVVYLG